MDELLEDVQEQLESMGFQLPSQDGDKVVDFYGYIKSIDWTQPWLIWLMFCHFIMLLLVLVSRAHIKIQALLGILMLSLVYMSESINEIAAKNWRSFSTEQYFDSKGLFISTVFSAPLLFNCLIIIINFLAQNYYALRDIQQLKVKQLTKSRRKKKEEDGVNMESKQVVNGEKKKEK